MNAGMIMGLVIISIVAGIMIIIGIPQFNQSFQKYNEFEIVS